MKCARCGNHLTVAEATSNDPLFAHVCPGPTVAAQLAMERAKHGDGCKCCAWGIAFNSYSAGFADGMKRAAQPPTDGELLDLIEAHATSIFGHEVCDSGELFASSAPHVDPAPKEPDTACKHEHRDGTHPKPGRCCESLYCSSAGGTMIPFDYCDKRLPCPDHPPVDPAPKEPETHRHVEQQTFCRDCKRVVVADLPCSPQFAWTAPASHHWMGDVAISAPMESKDLRHDIYVTTDGRVFDGCDAGCNGKELILIRRDAAQVDPSSLLAVNVLTGERTTRPGVNELERLAAANIEAGRGGTSFYTTGALQPVDATTETMLFGTTLNDALDVLFDAINEQTVAHDAAARPSLRVQHAIAVVRKRMPQISDHR